jgi:hypothetical protein
MRQPPVATVLIPLPVYYNPDDQGRRRKVEEEKFGETASEIAQIFGGGMLHLPVTGELTGFWCDRGIIDRDEMALFEVDIPDTAESRRRIETYARETLLKRFDQKAIYVRIVGPIETILVVDTEIRE